MSGDFKRLRVFVEVVRAGGFAAAARKLGMPRSTVSRWVQELEQQLGVRLLQRTTRKVVLTEIGEGYFSRGAKAVDAAGQASDWVQSQSEHSQGMLVITTFHLFAESMLGPLLLTYLKDNPQVSTQVIIDERAIDLVSEHVDVAVRVGPLPDSSLVVRKLADLKVSLVASPGYLEEHGTLTHPTELSAHSMVLYSHVREPIPVCFKNKRKKVQLSLESRYLADSIQLNHQLTLGGLGIGALPNVLIQEHLATGQLVEVLPEWSNNASQPIFVVYPSRSHLPRKVRDFVNLLVSEVTTETANHPST